MVELRLKPSPRGGFPSGFKVFYSTDHGEVWYPVGGANYNSFPDPGLEEVIVALHGVVGDALMIQASYLRRDLDGGYTFQLAEAKVIGHEQFGPFRTSRGDQWDADLNNMWRVFGPPSDGTQAVPAMGGESAWLEWNALKLCWYDDPSLKSALRDQYVNYHVGLDGYVWSWGNQEGWPTHGHRHYESNAKFILGACRYYLWSGDDGFLMSTVSATTDMAFAISHDGGEVIKWDSRSHVAIRLQEGRTIGQSFVAERSFSSVGGCYPTYMTEGAGMALSLYRGDVTGEIIASKDFRDVADNAWMMLDFPPQPAGPYYLEMSRPVGTIGWWSINDDVIPGESFSDGEVVVRDDRSVLDRLRSAMDFQLDQLQGRQGLLVITDPDSNGTHNGYPTDYWDNFPFGYMSAYCNVYFYASLGLMSEVERAVGNLSRADSLRSLMPLVKMRFNQAFWNEEAGRYIGCIDVLGQQHDYGFTYLNLEAITYGLADEETGQVILSWLSGERDIEGDYSRGKDIYRYVVAPRSTTIPVESVEPHWWYDIGGAISIGPGGRANYDEHLENGGMIFYTSFYDLMSRLACISPDDALARLDAIMTEFHKDQLRRDPPNSQGIPWKLGIIGEFPESGLVPAFVVHGFLGAEALSDGLHLHPRLPRDLTRLWVGQISYRGCIYDIEVSRDVGRPSIASKEGGYLVRVPDGCHIFVSEGCLVEVQESVNGIAAPICLGMVALGFEMRRSGKR